MANQSKQSSGNRQSGGQGFAGMSDEEQRRIAQKGGEAVSEDREHMAEIGRKGGEASAGNRVSQASSRSDRDVQESKSGSGSGNRSGSGSKSGSDSERGSSGRKN